MDRKQHSLIQKRGCGDEKLLLSESFFVGGVRRTVFYFLEMFAARSASEYFFLLTGYILRLHSSSNFNLSLNSKPRVKKSLWFVPCILIYFFWLNSDAIARLIFLCRSYLRRFCDSWVAMSPLFNCSARQPLSSG
jgi:hypothetical protein